MNANTVSGLKRIANDPRGGVIAAMQINGTSRIHGPQSINAPHRAQPTDARQNVDGVQQADQLDISQEADMISRMDEIPDIRSDRVAEIRAQIEAGTYETDDKLDTAVGRLLDEIG